MIQYISPEEGLWRAGVEERDGTKRCENASSAVNRDFGCKRGVVEGIGSPDEAGALL